MEHCTEICDLPAQASLYPFQVAGHVHGKGKTKLGMLKHENGHILKPLVDGDIRAVKELAFYKEVAESSDPLIKELEIFLPKFFGTWIGKIRDKEIQYLCLEDVCKDFQKPCVLDLKIGAQTYDPWASQEKAKLEKDKYPYAEILGFRILGMKVYKETYFYMGKEFGKQQTPETILDALNLYLCNNDKNIAYLVLSGFIHKLEELANWFGRQKKLAFYSSSLLFVYEGDVSSWLAWIYNNIALNGSTMVSHFSDSTNVNFSLESLPFVLQINSENICDVCRIQKHICYKIQTTCSLYRIVMIDFAHVYPVCEEDSNYIFGLNNFIKKLKELHQTYIQRIKQ